MGKKSKRSKPKKGQKGGGAAPAPAAAASSPTPERAEETQAHQPQPPPPAASCWICLDGDPDEGGKPIVRDCSCRGDDAGFAHLSCLVNYAENKTRDMEEAMDNASPPLDLDLTAPWRICPNCCREYQRRLAIDMAKALLSHIDKKYPPGMDACVQLDALSTIVSIVMRMDEGVVMHHPDLREEGKRAATQMLEVIQRSGHLVNEEYINDQRVYAYATFARFCEAEGTDESYGLALEYYTKAREFHQSRGEHEQVRRAEDSITRAKSMREGREAKMPSGQALIDLRASYGWRVKEKGQESSETIQSGIVLGKALLFSREHNLECERLCAKLLAISRRVHGPDHDYTDRIETCLEMCRFRPLLTRGDDGPVTCQILQVKIDEQKYIVKNRLDEISEVAFDDDYFIVPGTPVVCHGLKNAQHLNGKLGDVRDFDTSTKRFVVRFEDKSLNEALVKAANLRIVMDLPGES